MSQPALRQAQARQDTELATHEYTIMMVLRDRADQLIATFGMAAGQVARQHLGVELQLPVDGVEEFGRGPHSGDHVDADSLAALAPRRPR